MNSAIARGVYYSGSVYDVPFLASLLWLLWTSLQAHKWTLKPEIPPENRSRWVMLAPRLAMLAIISLPALGLWALLFDDSPLPLRRFRILAADCLRDGPKSPRDLARKLGLTPAGITSLLMMLASEGRVRVTRVELADIEEIRHPLAV